MTEKVLKTIFPEKITPFLKRKMETIIREKGENSSDYRGLALQYIKSEYEDADTEENNLRHYDAELDVIADGRELKGLERLYRRSLVIAPTTICVAHCRYCLRANYEIFTLSEKQMTEIAKYCGSSKLRDKLQEVLITGGDPLIIPQKLHYLMESMIEYAPNVKIFRIATRLLTQDPNRIDNNVFEIFREKPLIRFELATQINHPIEFFPETVDKMQAFSEMGVKIYSQNVLLKGVNDNIDTLMDLYDKMRKYDIEAHYLFHSIPLKGSHHLRTTVVKGLRLIKELVNSGLVSGRVKPMYAAMTDIGKITFYDGAIITKDSRNRLLLQSTISYKDRLAWNPNWVLPKTAEVDNDGLLRVWYLDGTDD